MTGNTKVWRAPLAGLASLAMIATMGVAAGTANAADAADTYKVTFKVDGKAGTSSKLDMDGAIQVTAGDSLADALQGYNTGISFAGIAGKKFVGWLNGSAYYDFNAPVTGDVTLTADLANTADAVLVKFTGVDDLKLAFPDASHSGEYYVRQGHALGAQRTPVDLADGKLVTSWNVDTNSDEGTGTTTQSDLTVQNVYDPEDGQFDISPNKVDRTVKTLTIKGDAVKGYVLGAKADGVNDVDYTKDVVKGKTAEIPAWVSATKNASEAPKVWKNEATDESVASPVTVDDNLTLVADGWTKTWTVTFKDASGNTVSTQKITDASPYLNDDQIADISAVKIDGFVVKGWKLLSGSVYDTYNKKNLATSNQVYSADFENYKISSDVVFEAVQGGFTTEVKVTFKDTDYRGSNDPVTATVKGGEYLDPSKAPSWTRDGYVLAGWTQSDNTDWDWNTLIGDTTLTQKDFTLTAKWVKTDGSVLDAALAYIKGEYTESGTTYPADKAEEYFTSETWGKFETVYQKVQNEKAQLVRASADGKVSDTDAARLVSELKAGWEQLKIDAKGNPGLDADGSNAPTQNEFVYRLHKDGLRLYSQTPVEIYAAQRTGWTLDNGYLFRAAPKNAAADKYFTKYESFDTAAKEAAKNGTSASDLAGKLDAVADPIIKTIQRYSSPNGTDWVYVASTGTAEINSLKRGGWNYEGTAFVVPTFGGTPVVRFALNGQHLMSTGVTEQNALVRAGWTREGVAFRGL